MRNLLRLSLRKYSREEIEAIYKPLLPRIFETNPLKVILTGSAVSGEFDDASDLDFVVVYPDDAEISMLRRKLYRLRAYSTRNLDFVCVTASRFEEMKELGGILMVANREGLAIDAC